MSVYRVIFNLMPGVRFEEKFDRFVMTSGKNSKVEVFQIIRNIEEVLVPVGLRFVITRESDNLHEAVKKSTEIVEDLTENFSFISGVGLHYPSLWIAYDVTPGIEEREFMQMIDNLIGVNISRGQLQPGYLQRIALGENPYNLDEKDRIQRSFKWFKMGIPEKDRYVAFTSYWTALETLELLLFKKINPSLKFQKCPSCHKELNICPHCDEGLQPPQKNWGLEKFIETQFPEKRNLYWKLNDLRYDILHGRRSLADIADNVADFTPHLVQAYVTAIHYLLNIERNSAEQRKPIKGGMIKWELTTTLVDFNPDEYALKGIEPFFGVTDIRYNPRIVDGSIQLKIEAKITTQFVSGKTKNGIFKLICKEADSDVTISEILIKKDNQEASVS